MDTTKKADTVTVDREIALLGYNKALRESLEIIEYEAQQALKDLQYYGRSNMQFSVERRFDEVEKYARLGRDAVKQLDALDSEGA